MQEKESSFPNLPKLPDFPDLPKVTHKPKSEHKSSNEKNCPMWEPDWEALKDVQPQVTLDPEKYLIPILTYGPNNQLRGFRETIFLALKLNRTIVPPPFYKHSRTDASNDNEGKKYF